MITHKNLPLKPADASVASCDDFVIHYVKSGHPGKVIAIYEDPINLEVELVDDKGQLDPLKLMQNFKVEVRDDS